VIRCHICGRFCRPKAWQMIYEGAPNYGPVGEVFRCHNCFQKYGNFAVQDGVKPEFSRGLCHKEERK
jgi:hypothetical protein